MPERVTERHQFADLLVDFVRLLMKNGARQIRHTVAVKGNPRDVEEDPVIAPVLESPFELHNPHPFGAKVAILYNGRIGFKSFSLVDWGAGEYQSVKPQTCGSKTCWRLG